ncbi:hypothetical protein [Streptodolium elevatio]|uniref:Uncharacterized protein n=1 Tax=Streptodolium elevatio TaxID=3157996 RepID=A0ABV3DKD2_9ACTN
MQLSGDALGIALRHTHDVVGDVPIVVSESGIATVDDGWRIAYTSAAPAALYDAVRSGVDVRGGSGRSPWRTPAEPRRVLVPMSGRAGG